ncbi:MAG: hypothetical protein QOJ39_3722 [Candidatus Eremiobacteraeota bacterium]|jgi:hypothetical protein|nr:hypothetical protein [Candidatus Eremiobacteraeota bacterium]
MGGFGDLFGGLAELFGEGAVEGVAHGAAEAMSGDSGDDRVAEARTRYLCGGPRTLNINDI